MTQEKGYHTQLIMAGKSYRFLTDMDAMEVAESLPDSMRWQVRLQHGKGVVDSEKYRAARHDDEEDRTR